MLHRVLFKALHVEELRGQPLLHPIEVENKDDAAKDCIQGAKEPANVSEVVQD